MGEENESNKEGAVAVVRVRAAELRKKLRAAKTRMTEIVETDEAPAHPHCVLPPYFFDRALHVLSQRSEESANS